MGDGGRDWPGQEWLLVRADGRDATRVELGAASLGIGRAPDNRLVLQDGYASARHAELVDRAGERCVRDLGSRNGTRLNGRALAPGVLQPLRDGDVIQIGSTDVTYRRGSAPNGAADARAVGAGRGQGPVGAGNRDDGHKRADARDLAVGPIHSGRPVPSGGAAPASAPVPQPASAPVVGPASASFPALPAPRRLAWARVRQVALRAVLVLLAVALLVAGVAWALAPARVVVLVMGSDARPDELRSGQVGRTDTLLALVADRSPAGAVLISIPRDLWVAIPGFGEERINVAYALGGPGTAERVAGDVLGVPVDRHLVIGLQGVRDIVDAAGGVEIDVERAIHDDAYPTDDYGTIVLDIPAGRQHMDGETALRYARTRHQDSDFGRMARQQRVMVALRNAMLRPTNWWRLPAVLVAVRRATQTDLGLPELATLAIAFGAGSSEPERLALGPGLVEDVRGADGAYLLRATPALRQRVSAALAPANAAVEVLNGTRTDGLARQAADTLRGRGVRVVNVGSAAPRSDTTVGVRPGFARAGANVAAILDLPRDVVREDPTLPDGVDVRVTLGEGRGRS